VPLWNQMGGGPRYDPSKPAGAAQQAPLKEEFKRIHEEMLTILRELRSA